MRLDELFKNLGYIAGTIGTQMREAYDGVPLAELDLTGPTPREVGLRGTGQIVLSEGETLAIVFEAEPDAEDVRFMRDGERLGVSGGDRGTVVRVTMPADLTPNKSVRLEVPLPAIADAGRYEIVFDMVVEGFAWFEQKGSITLTVPVIVT